MSRSTPPLHVLAAIAVGLWCLCVAFYYAVRGEVIPGEDEDNL